MAIIGKKKTLAGNRAANKALKASKSKPKPVKKKKGK